MLQGPQHGKTKENHPAAMEELPNAEETTVTHVNRDTVTFGDVLFTSRVKILR